MHLPEIIKILYKYKTIIPSKCSAGCDDSSSLFNQNLPFSKQLRSPRAHVPRQSCQRPRSPCPRRPVLPVPAPPLDRELLEAGVLFTHLRGPSLGPEQAWKRRGTERRMGHETTARNTLPWLRSRTGREDVHGKTGEI